MSSDRGATIWYRVYHTIKIHEVKIVPTSATDHVKFTLDVIIDRIIIDVKRLNVTQRPRSWYVHLSSCDFALLANHLQPQDLLAASARSCD